MIGLRIKQFTAIAGLTALEIVRQPACLILSSLIVLAIALLPLLVTQTLDEGTRLARDSGLALTFTGGLVVGVFAACAALRHEIRRGTVASVLAKPVSRSLLFLAKYAGVAAVMLVFCLECGLATLLSARTVAQSYIYDWWGAGPLLAAPPLAFALAGLHNYFTRRPFCSTAFRLLFLLLAAAFLVSAGIGPDGRWTTTGAVFEWRIVPAVALVAVAILLLTGVAASLATRLDLVPTLALSSAVFLAGLMSDYLFGRAAATSRLAAALYAALPDFQHFWTADALGVNGVPWPYVGHAAIYAGLYLAGVLCWGTLAFRNVEVHG